MNQILLEQYCGLPSYFSKYEKEQTEIPVGASGKVAICRLVFERFGEKTHLMNNFSQAPARVHRPLYYDPYRPGIPYVIFVNSSSGILQGDRYTYNFILRPGSEVVLTEKAATNIFKMDLNFASRRTDIYLGEHSRLEYLPRESIAFAKSRWFQSTVIHVENDSKFLYSEILCPGRIARNEIWDFSVYASKFLIEKDGAPILADSALWTKEDKPRMRSLFGDKIFLLNTYWYSKKLSGVKEQIDFKGCYGGATNMPHNSGLVIKALSDDFEKLRALQLGLWDLFRRTEVGVPAPDLRMH
jgi:urease accessory protein